MKIKTKIICVTGIVLFCVVVVSSVSIWTLNEISRLKETIDDGVELIGRARTIHSLMKDLMFDIFTPIKSKFCCKIHPPVNQLAT